MGNKIDEDWEKRVVAGIKIDPHDLRAGVATIEDSDWDELVGSLARSPKQPKPIDRGDGWDSIVRTEERIKVAQAIKDEVADLTPEKLVVLMEKINFSTHAARQFYPVADGEGVTVSFMQSATFAMSIFGKAVS